MVDSRSFTPVSHAALYSSFAGPPAAMAATGAVAAAEIAAKHMPEMNALTRQRVTTVPSAGSWQPLNRVV